MKKQIAVYLDADVLEKLEYIKEKHKLGSYSVAINYAIVNYQEKDEQLDNRQTELSLKHYCEQFCLNQVKLLESKIKSELTIEIKREIQKIFLK